jgi:hypothetical protein
VDVLAVAEGLPQGGNVGDVRKQAQLDLAVVGREQEMPRLGDEGAADPPPLLGADGDVLEVRVGRGEAARARRGHREGGVHAARFGIDLIHQRIGVSRL